MRRQPLSRSGLSLLAWCLALGSLAAPCSAETSAETLAGMRQRVAALETLTAAPAVHAIDPEQASPRRIYFDALPYRGKPTRCFAWLGIPPSASGKLPAMVLVHGGGGTAFRKWVEEWNEHGYAAIAVAVEGQTDEPDGKKWWKQHEWAGPMRTGIYNDSAEPMEDQWMYHAVADVILANSLLRSLPQVDPQRVGLMGISWGGIITSTVIGIDRRFAFAVPTYGCGELTIAADHFRQGTVDNTIYREVWEPTLRLQRATMPTLWLTFLYDKHFPLDAQQRSYRTATGPRMIAVVPDLQHGHGVAWNAPDSYAFADFVLADGKPWLRELRQSLENGRAAVEFESAKPIERAVLLHTTDAGYTGNRKWIETPAELKADGTTVRVAAVLPAETTAYFFNVRSGPLTASSEYVDLAD
ncbi:MAG TPA: acetylxylan esterase [Pirellulales bacterium]|nr:acetylxylan esterase [Pirellulales bacterium]